MEKLLLIIKREFLAKVKNKSFIIITILSPVIIVALMSFIIFIQNSSRNEFKNVAYIDTENVFTDIFIDTEHVKYIDLKDLTLDKAKLLTKESDYYALVYIPKFKNHKELENNISIFYEETVGMTFLTKLESKFSKKIRNLKLNELEIDLEKIKQSDTDVEIKTIKFSGEESSKISSGLKMAFGVGMGYMIFMFIIIYGNSVMRSVIEEKSNRIIEVIISSVKPFNLMLGKILGNALAGILQFVIWILLGFIFMTVLSTFLDIDSATASTQNLNPEIQNSIANVSEIIQEVYNLPLFGMALAFFFYFLGGYLVYSSIYAAIGAAVDSETDTQQFMIPVMMPLMIAIYAGFSIIDNPHSSISVGFSIFPLTSPIVMLMRIPFGVPFWQVAISMILLILTFLAIVFIAGKIYRIGILMHGKKPSYKEIYKWLKL